MPKSFVLILIGEQFQIHGFMLIQQLTHFCVGCFLFGFCIFGGIKDIFIHQ